MGQSPPTIDCPCDGIAKRIYGNFQFSEDRTRFFRNPVDGSKFSYSLGMEHPDTRADYRRVLDGLGCEPVTAKTMPERWKEDRQYLEHVQHGGERLPRDGAPEPKPVGMTIREQMDKSNFRVG